MKSDTRVLIETLALVVAVPAAVITGLVYIIPPITARECTETSTVKAIVELKYRDAVIELENGERRTVNQASLRPGDIYCSKWK